MIIGLIAFAVIIMLCMPAFDSIKRKTTGWYYHRGNHTEDQSVSENSMGAFKRAIDDEIGIEFDVRASKDDILYVFHDKNCERMCGDKRSIETMFGMEVDMLQLPDGSDIPKLSEVLATVSGKVSLMVEIKPTANYKQVCRLLKERLDVYEGDISIESFDPRIVYWFRRNAPKMKRGQLVMRPGQYDNPLAGLFVWLMIPNLLTQPHYMATHKTMWPYNPLLLLFRLLGGSTVAWTTRASEHDRACKADAAIVEYYKPGK